MTPTDRNQDLRESSEASQRLIAEAEKLKLKYGPADRITHVAAELRAAAAELGKGHPQWESLVMEAKRLESIARKVVPTARVYQWLDGVRYELRQPPQKGEG